MIKTINPIEKINQRKVIQIRKLNNQKKIKKMEQVPSFQLY